MRIWVQITLPDSCSLTKALKADILRFGRAHELASFERPLTVALTKSFDLPRASAWPLRAAAREVALDLSLVVGVGTAERERSRDFPSDTRARLTVRERAAPDEPPRLRDGARATTFDAARRDATVRERVRDLSAKAPFFVVLPRVRDFPPAGRRTAERERTRDFVRDDRFTTARDRDLPPFELRLDVFGQRRALMNTYETGEFLRRLQAAPKRVLPRARVANFFSGLALERVFDLLGCDLALVLLRSEYLAVRDFDVLSDGAIVR